MTSNVESSCIKELTDHSNLEANGLPSLYMTRSTAISESDTIVKEEIPTIDFALLKNGSPDERLKIIHDINLALKDWSCFRLINHGMPESTQKSMIEAFGEFFDLTTEEKEVYKLKNVFDLVGHGTSFSLSGNEERYWRDFLRTYIHPELNSPDKPSGFSAKSEEYGRESREIMRELLRAIWESLELEVSVMEETLELKSTIQMLVGNLYPLCPNAELVYGMPPHTDPSLISLIMQQNNAYNGLQVLHNDKWVVADLPPNSFMILVGDFLEIVSNGKYMGSIHRVFVSNECRRITVGTSLSPPLETVMAPAPKLLEDSKSPTTFNGVTFKEIVVLKRENKWKNPSMELIKV